MTDEREAIHKQATIETRAHYHEVMAWVEHSSGLDEQVLELGHRAISAIAAFPELSGARRLTLNLLGSTYFWLGQITRADECYAEALNCPEQDDLDTLILLYHGRSICAQKQGKMGDPLMWSSLAAASARLKLDCARSIGDLAPCRLGDHGEPVAESACRAH
ncbi:MAG: hypothetical protein KGZ53_10935 [Peptococcaceae bacterium]|nr:hypothetical protein [Peptococcaceae bacterium]